jgi:hypothetical protein
LPRKKKFLCELRYDDKENIGKGVHIVLRSLIDKPKNYLFIGLLGSLAFLRLRALLPFVDEAVHYWWILRALEAGEWLRPLNVGKPLEAWLAAPLAYLGGDPLVIMRSLHVLAGLFTVLLTFQIAELVTSSRIIALSSAVLIALCPFLIYLERMALAEIYLCAGGLLVTIATPQILAEFQPGKSSYFGPGSIGRGFYEVSHRIHICRLAPSCFRFCIPRRAPTVIEATGSFYSSGADKHFVGGCAPDSAGAFPSGIISRFWPRIIGATEQWGGNWRINGSEFDTLNLRIGSTTWMACAPVGRTWDDSRARLW